VVRGREYTVKCELEILMIDRGMDSFRQYDVSVENSWDLVLEVDMA